MKNVQHLKSANPSKGQDEGWAKAKGPHRKKRSFLVGQNEENYEVQTVPRYVSLHVTRLRPNTKPEDLRKIIEPHLPGMSCEIHKSKRRDIYESMKVTLRRDLLRGSNISVFCHQDDASGQNGSSADDLTQTETSQPRSRTKTAQTRDQLDILHLNVQCLNNKIDDLSVFLAENPFHVLCFSEIWLTSGQIPYTGIGNYTLASFFCRQKFKHGGVAIYVMNNVTSLVINVEKFFTEIAAEFTAIKVENSVIVTIYRSTNGDLELFLNSLENMLEYLRKRDTIIVLIGEFNVNFLVDRKTET
ncbi:hypothetical protein JTB14_019013 [Gonioctena quinquepunctata]|nr:hypothetical protein JTB14_019013 [Gonioctena quinquepunctata]